MTSTDWLHCQKSEERKPRVATRPFKGRDNRLSQGSERVTQRNQFSTHPTHPTNRKEGDGLSSPITQGVRGKRKRAGTRGDRKQLHRRGDRKQLHRQPTVQASLHRLWPSRNVFLLDALRFTPANLRKIVHEDGAICTLTVLLEQALSFFLC